MEPRSVRIGPSLSFTRENFLLLDQEQPKADPNELLKLKRGQQPDPQAADATGFP